MKLLLQNKIAILFLVCMSLFACKKDAGQGGTSTIRGKVITHNFDPSYQILGEIYPEAEQKVYIIYGDENTTYDDNNSTSFDGSYEFKFLQKGTYKLFVYSNDSTGAAEPPNITPSIKKAVFVTVEIKNNGETVDAPDLIILKNNFQ